MWCRIAAALALAGCSGFASAACLNSKDPYADPDIEPNPWGWPLTPNDFSYSEDATCWKDKYAMCNGALQSPADLPACTTGSSQQPPDITPGFNNLLATVQKSAYMRSVMLHGSLGSLTIDGHKYTAMSVHVVAPALHSVAGVDGAVAEVVVVTKKEDTRDHSFLALSVLLQEGSDSTLLTAMDVTDDKVDKGSWKGSDVNQGLVEVIDTLKKGYSSYHGSMPVPPCWQTVTWAVANGSLSASAAQVSSLHKILHDFSDDALTKRQVDCQHVSQNALAPPGNVCEGLTETQPMLTSPCWPKAGCSTPKELPSTPMAQEPFSLMANYKTVDRVTAHVTDFTLDFHAGHEGHDDFGHLDIHGRQFVASTVSVKAISMHTNGTDINAGELVIRHSLFGDHLAAGSPMHEVHVSIPLKLGDHSPMLQALGLGNSEHQEAVRDGEGYTKQADFNLAEFVNPIIAGEWFWYDGSSAFPTDTEHCGPEWGVRWLVSHTPMQVSLSQLNTLALKVAGMDSSMVPFSTPAGFDFVMPAWAADRDAACDPSDWENFTYDNIHCWAGFEITNNMCGAAMPNRQSPINIDTSQIAGTGNDVFLHRVRWTPVEGLKVVVKEKVSLRVASMQLGYAELYSEEDDGFPGFFQVTNLSMHMPSQHTIDGQHFAGELQVAMNKQFSVFNLHSDDAAIASFMYKIGRPSLLLEQLFHAAESEHHEVESPVDLMQAFGPALEGDFYRYSGSLTTPNLACSEVVKWFVFSTPLEMSQEQVDKFREWIPSPGNNRPIQTHDPPLPVYMNSFQEGTLPQHDFYLGRNTARDRVRHGENMILLPVFGSIVLAVIVMASTFVHQDVEVKQQQAGGLVENNAIGTSAEKI